jgi:hypothetical protein
MTQDEKQAWDRYYAAAVIAMASSPAKETGTPLDSLNNTPASISHKAAGLADMMLEQRKRR